MYGEYLIKEFIQSLKENAFDQYIDLELSSIDFWEKLEQEFLNHFCSTRRIISMLELTKTCQAKDEQVITLSIAR